MFNRKKIFIPTEETKVIEAIESYKVTWKSHSDHSYEATEQCEFIPNEKDANELADSIREAFKLIRQKVNIEVEVKKNV
jgi:hypothetical protein